MMAEMTSSEYGRLLEPWLIQAAGYARSLLLNKPDAEDAVQQAALRGLERIRTYDAKRPFKGWWFAIVRNSCFDLLRKRKSSRLTALGDQEITDERNAEPARWRQLAEQMARLSHDHEEILRLRYFGGLDYSELACALDIPLGTVMSRLHFARKALAEKMKKEDI
jgi:RNA polymerase sigma-70 factor (ECF subfamily)